jgi:uncharacterized membrane protein YfcA
MYQARFFDTATATRRAVLLLLTGIIAGVINGLLGAGGGIIVVLLLSAWQRRGRVGRTNQGYGDDPRDVYAASLTAMLPVSILSAVQYAGRGALSFADFSLFLLPAILGGVIGGLALDRVRVPFLQKLFAYLLLLGGVRMLLR